VNKIRVHIEDIGGKIAKQDERYVVKDNTALKNLVVSSTALNPGKHTSGHRHAGQEEVYYFITGSGRMQLDDDMFDFTAGDVILIADDVFHKVYAGDDGAYFVCVFDGSRNH